MVGRVLQRSCQLQLPEEALTKLKAGKIIVSFLANVKGSSRMRGLQSGEKGCRQTVQSLCLPSCTMWQKYVHLQPISLSQSHEMMMMMMMMMMIIAVSFTLKLGGRSISIPLRLLSFGTFALAAAACSFRLGKCQGNKFQS